MSDVQPRSAAEMVVEAKGRVQNLSPEQVSAEIYRAEEVTLVDIREDDERVQNGAISGAVRAPRGMLEFWADPTSPYHREEFSPERGGHPLLRFRGKIGAGRRHPAGDGLRQRRPPRWGHQCLEGRRSPGRGCPPRSVKLSYDARRGDVRRPQ